MTKTKQTYFLIDFDSTFITVEGLEVFAAAVLKGNKNKTERLAKISLLTNQAMEGKLSFAESLGKRIQLLSGNKKQVTEVGKLLKEKISPSVLHNKDFFLKHKDYIYIISGGFKEFIYPVVKQFGIRSDHIFANTFVYDNNESIIGIDTNNPMSQDNGKVKVVESLKLEGDIFMIGDGYTDYELKKRGHVKKFIAFTENIARDTVIKHADEIAPTFDEFLYVNKLPRSLSYPKNRIEIFAFCPLTPEIKEQLAREHYQFATKDTKNAAILYIDRFDQSTREFIKKAQRLLAVGILDKTLVKELPKELAEKGIAVFQEANPTKRVIDFINTGDTYKNITLPAINLPKHIGAHRLLHIHKNKPGMLAQINTVMAMNSINIISQYLQTTPEIGYVITDVDKKYDKNVIQHLKKIPHTIRFRVLY